MTKDELFQKAIELNDQNYWVYYKYAAWLESKGKTSTKIKNKNNRLEKKTVQDLYVMGLGTNNSWAYLGLGDTLTNPKDFVLINRTTSMTKQQLYLKAQEQDPNNPYTYYKIAYTMNRGDIINASKWR